MNFKFKKGDKVKIKYGEMFAKTLGGVEDQMQTIIGDFEITDRKNSVGTMYHYKLKGLKGWWEESHLVAAAVEVK